MISNKFLVESCVSALFKKRMANDGVPSVIRAIVMICFAIVVISLIGVPSVIRVIVMIFVGRRSA